MRGRLLPKKRSNADKRAAARQYAYMAKDPTLDVLMRCYGLAHLEAETMLIEARRYRGTDR